MSIVIKIARLWFIYIEICPFLISVGYDKQRTCFSYIFSCVSSHVSCSYHEKFQKMINIKTYIFCLRNDFVKKPFS